MGIDSLDSALSGLRVAQQQLDTIAGNVSNANTDGYTRKILPQQTVVALGQTAGVIASPITRNVDLNLENEFWTQSSAVSFYDVQSTYLNQIQQFNGAPGSAASIAAKVAALKDAFAALSNSPEDPALRRAVVNQAATVASGMNGFAALIKQMGNDAQNDLTKTVSDINSKLKDIADLNGQVRFNKAGGKTTAAIEDQRDTLIKSLAQEIGITTFVRSDGVTVVQTTQGVQLADQFATQVYFKATPIGPSSYYPASAAGLYVGGDPATNPNTIDITQKDVGGKIGGLLDLRDNLLPQQQGMMDELAHQMAMRFDSQGLKLFTDANGNIPADTAPDPTTVPPTPVTYVGFSSQIQVNAAIVADNSLVQSGTVATDLPVASGSDEVIQRILNNTFGTNAYQEADGTVDLRASGGPATLQDWLGIHSQNRVTGSTAVSNYTDMNTLIAAGGLTFTPLAGPPLTDQFNLTFEENRTVPPLGPTTVNISLGQAAIDFPIGVGVNDALDQLIGEINQQIAGAGVPAGLNAQASRNPYGQLVLTSTGNITIDSTFPNGMTQAGLDYLGLTEGTTVTTDPYITVQVGDTPQQQISIGPADDENTLTAALDKISAADAGVPGLAVSLDPLTGFLTLRPGDSVANPVFGGNLSILGGPFQADGTGTIPGGIVAGTSLVAALFGSNQPVNSVAYSSPTAVAGVSVPFRSDNLGPAAAVSTSVISSDTLIDYAQKMIDKQASDYNTTKSQEADASSYNDLLQKNFLNQSGVNIDEELSHMIIVQTAYSAAARVMTSINQQFQTLLNAFQ